VAIRIEGEVEHPLVVTPSALRQLPYVGQVADFTCEEGWTLGGVAWGGYWLADVLALASPTSAARFVAVSSGSFTASLALNELERRALLAISRDGKRLTERDGGPFRLVVLGGPCYHAVKRVERIELTAAPPEDSARRIALARIGRSS